jgi:hypothetical protein
MSAAMLPDSRLCPARFVESLRRYADQRIETGGFLRACLQNELAEAIGYADERSLEALPHIVAYLMNHMPRVAWGSQEAVNDWLARRT